MKRFLPLLCVVVIVLYLVSIGLFFMPRGIDPDRAFNTTRGIEKKGGVVLDGPYSGGNFRLNNTAMPGHICKSCRRIVMEY